MTTLQDRNCSSGNISDYNEIEMEHFLAKFTAEWKMVWKIFMAAALIKALLNAYFAILVAIGLKRGVLPKRRFILLLSLALSDVLSASGIAIICHFRSIFYDGRE